jgi:hypothetical protein
MVEQEGTKSLALDYIQYMSKNTGQEETIISIQTKISFIFFHKKLILFLLTWNSFLN